MIWSMDKGGVEVVGVTDSSARVPCGCCSCGEISPPINFSLRLGTLRILFHSGKHETVLGWMTAGFELYAVFEPLVTKPVIINAVNQLLKWIRKEEDRLFILNSPTF